MKGMLTAVIVPVLAVGCTPPEADLHRQSSRGETNIQVYYLEIVTPEVDAVCAVYAAANGLQFGAPDSALGYARTASMAGGGLVGVRAPLRESEVPVVRPLLI